jgi:hypothetical protein
MPEITAKGAGANSRRAASASRFGNSSHSDPITRPTNTRPGSLSFRPILLH